MSFHPCSSVLSLTPVVGQRQGIDSIVPDVTVSSTARGLLHRGFALVNHAKVHPTRPGVWENVPTMSYSISGPAGELWFQTKGGEGNRQAVYLYIRFERETGRGTVKDRPRRYIIDPSLKTQQCRVQVPACACKVTFSIHPILDCDAGWADGAVVTVSDVELVQKSG